MTWTCLINPLAHGWRTISCYFFTLCIGTLCPEKHFTDTSLKGIWICRGNELLLSPSNCDKRQMSSVLEEFRGTVWRNHQSSISQHNHKDPQPSLHSAVCRKTPAPFPARETERETHNWRLDIGLVRWECGDGGGGSRMVEVGLAGSSGDRCWKLYGLWWRDLFRFQLKA